MYSQAVQTKKSNREVESSRLLYFVILSSVYPLIIVQYSWMFAEGFDATNLLAILFYYFISLRLVYGFLFSIRPVIFSEKPAFIRFLLIAIKMPFFEFVFLLIYYLFFASDRLRQTITHPLNYIIFPAVGISVPFGYLLYYFSRFIKYHNKKTILSYFLFFSGFLLFSFSYSFFIIGIVLFIIFLHK